MKTLPISLVFAALALVGCGDNSMSVGGGGDDDNGGDDTDTRPAYVTSSLVFGADGTTSYVSVLADLNAQTIDYTKAREFGDLADVWSYDGAVFVTEATNKTITRFAVKNGALVEEGKLSLANYGPTDVGFWRNTFISPTKAYFLNNTDGYVIWNPTDMVITGTLALPTLETRAGYMTYPGYTDRSAVIRDGKLYQPLYWTDDTYFQMTPDSRIAVFDVASDTSVGLLTAPCPGLDYVTQGDDGSLYFSSWIFAAGGALVLHEADTCVVKLPPGSDTPSVAFHFKDVADARQGAALHSIGNGKAIMSVLHGEHAVIDPDTDAGDVTYADNWRFWLYDFASNTAEMIPALDWNDGGQYFFTIDGKNYLLVSKSDYSATSVFDLGDTSAPTPLFDTQGWAIRLFKVR